MLLFQDTKDIIQCYVPISLGNKLPVQVKNTALHCSPSCVISNLKRKQTQDNFNMQMIK